VQRKTLAKRPRALRRTITVDPGWNTAIAFWHGEWMPMMHVIGLPRSMRGKDVDWGVQVYHMASQFQNVMSCINEVMFPDSLTRVIIEGVEMWEGNLTSMTATRRGDTFRLASLAGAYAGVATMLGVKEIDIWPARRWKGQLTKAATEARVKRVWNRYLIEHKSMSDHEYDAIGLGFAAMGEL